jgi:hypothetical protein
MSSPWKKLGFAVSLGALATASAAARADADSYVRYTGTAISQRTDQFLYREDHVVQYRDGRITGGVVLYTCRDGSPFARKTLTYVDRLSPDFTLEDASNGMREGIRSAGTTREVFFRGGGGHIEKTNSIPQVSGLVADSGFDEFVRINWQSLMEGRALTMNFLIPSRLDDMGFRVQHVGTDRVQGQQVEIFRLKLSGWMGLIAPSIDVYYSSANHQLVRYVGLSDLRDQSNDNLKAEVTFPPSDRKSGAPRDIDDARQVRLSPCK